MRVAGTTAKRTPLQLLVLQPPTPNPLTDGTATETSLRSGNGSDEGSLMSVTGASATMSAEMIDVIDMLMTGVTLHQRLLLHPPLATRLERTTANHASGDTKMT